MTKKSDDRKKDTMENIAVGLGNQEVVGRYGSANAEYIKGYTGVDNETAKQFQKSLKKISKGKVNPEYADQNIKQQAGYSAEVAKVSRDNAENIIAGKSTRTIRADDHPDFGVNDTVYDHVETVGGKVIHGSGSQMKFVSNPEALVDKIAKGHGGGKNVLSRYLDAKLDLPSDQASAVKKYCAKQAARLRKQAEKIRSMGDDELAARLEKQAVNYDKVNENIRDSGMTTTDAIFYREHPELATVIDITKVSHRAGIEGAKCGLVIGGAFALVTNTVAVYQDNKDLKEALCDTAMATAKAAALGYGTGFAGSTVKGAMQQAKSGTFRQLSKTSLPTLVVSICLELTSSIKRYASGEIDRVKFMEEIGEKGSGMLASGMMMTVGQIAIPIPVVGGILGGMVGYTLSSLFYQSSLEAFRGAKRAHEEYLRIKEQCEAARAEMDRYRRQLRQLFDTHMTEIHEAMGTCFTDMDIALTNGDMDAFALSANNLAGFLGKTLAFSSMEEFEIFMVSDEPLTL